MITCDWHIHSRNSCDEACIPVRALTELTRDKGITDYGLTDHLHTPCNLPDIAASRAEFLESKPPRGFHFGVEVSCVSQWELDEIASGRHGSAVYGLRSGGPAGGALAIGLTAGDISQLGIEYVVGGAHWPMYCPMEREAVIRDYHRQNLFLATHPLVDVVAHPWWWMGHWQDADGCYTTEPWFDNFGVIPQSMHREFAAAAMQHDAIVEINLEAIVLTTKYPERFRRQYLDYLAELKAQGVKLTVGSDCHDERYDTDFARASQLLAGFGICDRDLWRLPPRSARSDHTI